MRKPRTLWIGGGFAEAVNGESDQQIRRRVVGVNLLPWLSAAQCRRLAAWLVKAAEWIEAKEEGR